MRPSQTVFEAVASIAKFKLDTWDKSSVDERLARGFRALRFVCEDGRFARRSVGGSLLGGACSRPSTSIETRMSSLRAVVQAVCAAACQYRICQKQKEARPLQLSHLKGRSRVNGKTTFGSERRWLRRRRWPLWCNCVDRMTGPE
jgi:hypothetical protein